MTRYKNECKFESNLLFLQFMSITHQQLQMNTSNAFSDYMVTYSVNKSINLSPTMGRLHKHRQSSTLGPTICLINRSREKIEESTGIEEKQQDLIARIFMLSLEVERLNEDNRQLRGEREEKSSIQRLKEASLMREENERLKMTAERHQNVRFDTEKKYSDQIYQLKEKIAVCEAENRTLNRRVRQNEKQLEQLQLKGKINQSAVSRAKMDASRMMEMSMRFDSTNIDLHKSITKEKIMEVESLREKVQRCQQIIRDQKFIINGQKEEIGKEKGKQIEIEQLYQRELEFLRRQLNQSHKEGSQISQQDVKKLQTQIRDWQSRVIKSEEELKDKCLIIANQVKTISDQESRSNQLQRLVQDMEFTSHSRLIRAEEAAKLANKEKERQSNKFNKEMLKYLQQIEILKTVIEQYRQNMAQKDNEVQYTAFEMKARLKQKEQEVRKLRRRDREQQSDTKMSKSISVDNINISNMLKTSKVNLGHVVNSVMEMKQSNDRSTKILGRSFAIAKEIYYAK